MTPANRTSMHQQLKVLCVADMNVYAKGRARARAVAVAEYANGVFARTLDEEWRRNWGEGVEGP